MLMKSAEMLSKSETLSLCLQLFLGSRLSEEHNAGLRAAQG